MIYCYNCGKKNNNTAEFCAKCQVQLFHGMPGMEESPKYRSSRVFYGICLAVLIAIIFLFAWFNNFSF